MTIKESLLDVFTDTVHMLQNPDEFDLSPWLYPVSIGACSYVKHSCTNINDSVRDNLETIGFPEGIQNEQDMFSRIKTLNLKGKTYLPILSIGATEVKDREDLRSAFVQALFDILPDKYIQNKNSVIYPIAELVTNIFEHSGAGYGKVMAQYYPQKKFLDLVIVDNGLGLAGTYKKNGIHCDSEGAFKNAFVDIVSSQMWNEVLDYVPRKQW